MTAFTFSDKKILIIEDQRPFLILLKGLIGNLGASSISTCQTAEKAVSLCRSSSFDIVICDLHLGNDKKNGFELVEELRVQKWLKPQSIFIIISADSARPVVMGSKERRPDDYLIKPFSQAQLKSRIIRAWKKRQFLAPIFVASDKGHLNQAIDIAKGLMQNPSPYQGYCLQVLIELYWKTKQYNVAMQIVEAHSFNQAVMWLQIAKGKTEIALGQFKEAITTSDLLLKKNRFCVEAHDILAEAQSALNQPEDALTTIQDALKISPYSLDRLFITCRIARETGDYVLASKTCLSIWEQSKRSVYSSTSHWCSYVRSLLDAAEYADDRKRKNSFQQQALLAVQRSRFDDVLSRLSEEFDVLLFEELINARINAIDGKLIEAKRIIANSQFTIEKRYDEFPKVYAPDSIHTLLKIGEYEQAQSVIDLIGEDTNELDPNSQYTIARAKNDAKEKLVSYTALNRTGIRLYEEGKFLEAKSVFEDAQKIAPVNTGVALNLLQCLVKLLTQQTKKKVDPKFISECRKILRLIEGVPLIEQHQLKFDALLEELDPILK